MGPCLTPTRQQVECIAKLRGNSDFAVFLEVLQEYERELVERAVNSADSVQIHRASGGVLALRELHRFYVSAPADVAKYTSKKEYA